MYGEDLELSLRLRLAGWGVGIVPIARVEHDYEFTKGDYKWFHLERNRWWTLLATYPASLLLLLAPALAGFELALLAVAARNGWLAAKLRSQRALMRSLPWALRRRRRVTATRRVPATRVRGRADRVARLALPGRRRPAAAAGRRPARVLAASYSGCSGSSNEPAARRAGPALPRPGRERRPGDLRPGAHHGAVRARRGPAAHRVREHGDRGRRSRLLDRAHRPRRDPVARLRTRPPRLGVGRDRRAPPRRRRAPASTSCTRPPTSGPGRARSRAC